MSGDPAARSVAPVDAWEIFAFASDLAMLAALAVAGWTLKPSAPAGLIVVFALPGLTGLLWGTWLAPRARRRLTEPALTSARILLLVSSGALLLAVGQPHWAVVLTAAGVTIAIVLARRHR